MRKKISRLLAKLVPKQKNLVVLTTGSGKLEGDLRYFFLYLNKFGEQGFNYVFLTNREDVYQKLTDKGIKVWLYPRLLTSFKLLRARLLIADGHKWLKKGPSPLLAGAKKVRLWPGGNIKSSKQKRRQEKGELHLTAITRTDIFFNSDLSAAEIGGDSAVLSKIVQCKEQGYRLVAYTPATSLTKLKLDWSTLDAFARLNKLIFVIKLSNKDKRKVKLAKYENLVEYNRKRDPYFLLAQADMLLTAPSSFTREYLVADKPVLFFCPHNSKSPVASVELIPGPCCPTEQSVRNEIYRHLMMNDDRFVDKRQQVRQKLFGPSEGDAAAKLWESIKHSLLH